MSKEIEKAVDRFFDGLLCCVFAFTSTIFLDTIACHIGRGEKTHPNPGEYLLVWVVISILWGFSFMRVIEIVGNAFRYKIGERTSDD